MIDPYISDWLNLLARWFHIVVGAAWIGTSFYFNWLNNNIRPPKTDTGEGVKGELWSVHGGGFYQVRKVAVTAGQLPETLHWFKYEAYFTWISGICLLIIVYYLGADRFLLDPSVSDISASAGIGMGIATLVVGWLVYDLMCRSPLHKQPVAFAAIGFLLTTAVAYGLSQFLSPRAAYIHIGALLGTCMALNVFFVIIPGQRQMVDALEAGQEPNPEGGRRGSLRSLHNNYMTLPVLFIMVSNHYPITFGHKHAWAVLAAIALLGAGVRHWFNLKGKGKNNVWILPVAAIGMVSLAFVSAPERLEPPAGGVTFAEVESIITQRCTPCHAEQPTHPSVVVPPKDLVLEEPEQIVRHATAIKTQSVDTRMMPLGNLTGMTDAERAVISAWVEAGAEVGH
ncbi:MAG: putative membrane protein [Myxococcota bacterium]|jgi:uncharacterized membrane protein